jgi:spore coat polysaccharide biosynthesis protein SpsF
MDICGQPMLGRVVNRVRYSGFLTEIVVVTSTKIQDNQIVDYCRASDVAVFRGSEADVLDRYYWAAKEYKAENVVRITADCPFIDSEIIDTVIGAFDSAEVDYASNTLERTFPRGLDVEVFSFAALSKAQDMAKEDYQRTHVTPFIYEHPDLFQLHSIVAPVNHTQYRLTVDQIEDLEFARVLYERLDNHNTFSWLDVISILELEPELAAINRDVKQRSLYKG